MSRLTGRLRPWASPLIVLVAGVSLSMSAFPARADHDDDVTGSDPAAYGEPHPGWMAPPRGTGPLAPATGALFGTHSEDSHSGELTAEDQHILDTEEALGFRMHINNSYYGNFEGIARDWDPDRPDKRGLSQLAFWDVEMGRIPLVGWGCGPSDEINDGDHDETIRKTAQAMGAFGHEFFMRYCWEMDGDKRSEPGPADEFVAAWTRIYEIFQAEGADNVVWVWCANANGFKHDTDRGEWAWDYYPGDEYVDWVSADGYNWGVSRRNDWGDGDRDRWRGFIEIYDEFMVWARSTGPASTGGTPTEDMPAVFPRKHEVKPIMIGEYAAQDDPRPGMEMRKAEWMKATHDTVNGDKARTPECPHCGVFSDIAAMVYFDINADESHQNGDWRILSSQNSIDAMLESVTNEPWFHQIHTLGWAPAANRPDVPAPAQNPPAQNPPGEEPPAPEPSAPPPGGQSGSPGAVERSGYWMLGGDGTVYPFGEAPGLGAARLAAAVVDVEPAPSGRGYWVVDAGGGVSAHGDAPLVGDVAGRLSGGEVVTSLSATPTGEGYWMFTDRGRVFPFGDAAHQGDMAGVALNGPVLDSVATPSGRGYYLVASDGGIFAFGDARFFGSMGGQRLNQPVRSLVPDPDGTGYWLVASDGGVFAFEAGFRGSMGATSLNRPVTGMVAFGNGYLMVAADGGVFNFSDRPFHGSLGHSPPDHPIVALAPLP